jgi:hypothetical protein
MGSGMMLKGHLMPWIPASKFGATGAQNQGLRAKQAEIQKEQMLQNCWYGLPISKKTRLRKPHKKQKMDESTSTSNLGGTNAQNKGLRVKKAEIQKEQTLQDCCYRYFRIFKSASTDKVITPHKRLCYTLLKKPHTSSQG